MARVNKEGSKDHSDKFKAFQRQIKVIRVSKGWSQEHVALQMHCSIPAYSKIETGITDLNLSRLMQMAEVFDVSLYELMLPLMCEGDQAVQAELVHNMKLLLAQKDQQIIRLQSQVIELLGEAVSDKLLAETV